MHFNKMMTALLAALMVLSFAFDSQAAVSKKSKKTEKKQTRKTLQVYSAYEAEDEEPEMMAPVAPLSEIKVAPAVNSDVRMTEPYFSVPTRQTQLIAARLQIVEAILIESGRAYDYRSHTTQQLKDILREIRSQKIVEKRLAE